MTNFKHTGRRVLVPAGGTIAGGDMVVLSSNTVVAAADSCTTGIFGVAVEAAVSGDWLAVERFGVFAFTTRSTVNLTVLDWAYVYTASQVDAGSQSDVACGVVVDREPAASDTDTRIQITPSDLCSPITHA